MTGEKVLSPCKRIPLSHNPALPSSSNFSKQIKLSRNNLCDHFYLRKFKFWQKLQNLFSRVLYISIRKLRIILVRQEAYSNWTKGKMIISCLLGCKEKYVSPCALYLAVSIILFRYRIHFFAEEENLKRQSRFESVRPFPPPLGEWYARTLDIPLFINVSIITRTGRITKPEEYKERHPFNGWNSSSGCICRDNRHR